MKETKKLRSNSFPGARFNDQLNLSWFDAQVHQKDGGTSSLVSTGTRMFTGVRLGCAFRILCSVRTHVTELLARDQCFQTPRNASRILIIWDLPSSNFEARRFSIP